MATNGVISRNIESFRGGYWLNLEQGVSALLVGRLIRCEAVPTPYQDLNGVQLATDWSMIVSWSKALEASVLSTATSSTGLKALFFKHCTSTQFYRTEVTAC